jgi:hypothetical protein
MEETSKKNQTSQLEEQQLEGVAGGAGIDGIEKLANKTKQMIGEKDERIDKCYEPPFPKGSDYPLRA